MEREKKKDNVYFFSFLKFKSKIRITFFAKSYFQFDFNDGLLYHRSLPNVQNVTFSFVKVQN